MKKNQTISTGHAQKQGSIAIFFSPTVSSVGEENFIIYVAFFPNSSKSPRSPSVSNICNGSAQLVVHRLSGSRLWVRISPSLDFFEKAENIPVFSGRLVEKIQFVLLGEKTNAQYLDAFVIYTCCYFELQTIGLFETFPRKTQIWTVSNNLIV